MKTLSDLRAELSTLSQSLESPLKLRDQLESLLGNANHIGNNLREVIEVLTGEGFSWLVLRRTDRSQTCPCVKDSQPQGSCNRCLGTGFPFVDSTVKGYLWDRTPGVEFYTAAGRIATRLRNLVVENNQPVRKHDQLIEISLDPDTGEPRQPFEILRMYVLSDVLPMRGKGGRVEFWKAVAEERALTDDRRGEGGTGYNHTSNR